MEKQIKFYNGDKDIVTKGHAFASLSLKVEKTLNPPKQLAKAKKHNDLFYVDAVLVSTGMNANGDCFGKNSLWAAKRTPINKPSNIDHYNDVAIGHIFDTWALEDIENQESRISFGKSIQDVPNVFHLACSSVLYMNLEGDVRDRINELVIGIEAGEKAVSMEVWFDDFDYAFVNKDGSLEVVARGEDTSFLSWHLKSYGGDGVYDGRTVGRYLKNLEFSGMGFTSIPANKDSIIMESGFEKASNKGVQPVAKVTFAGQDRVNEIVSAHTNPMQSTANIKENPIMSDELQKELVDLKVKAQRFDEIVVAREEMKKALASKEEVLAKVNKELDEANAQKAKASLDIEEKAKAYEELVSKNKKLEGELELATQASKKSEEETKKLKEDKENLEKEKNKERASRIFSGRVSQLVTAGIAEEESKAFVTKWEAMEEEPYKEIANLRINEFKNSQSIAQITEQLKNGGTPDPSILDNLKPDASQGPDLATASKKDDGEKFKALGSAISSGFKGLNEKRKLN